ncbi:hypothetical protein OH491_13325 [Termitidicoccus mucosus]|uniref:Lipoprotein n=1 Tax=Termitidicoccus mucosus TaxID=1184151 RepID=A0A178IJ95_9BACT|nr:hypothetical protein AW736_14125 [Opitutaceae bacterium TSB47]
MKNKKHHIAIITAALAALFASGCTTPAGQKVQEGNQQANQVMDGVDSANSTANRAADTANTTADTVNKVNETLNRFFK